MVNSRTPTPTHTRTQAELDPSRQSALWFPLNGLSRVLSTGSVALALVFALGFSPASVADDHEEEHEELEHIEAFLEVMSHYFGLIDAVHEVSSDVEKSAIHQMHKLQEIYEDRGEEAKIVGVLRGVLEKSENPTIRNAAYMMLADALKDTGQADAALEALKAGLEENLSRK